MPSVRAYGDDAVKAGMGAFGSIPVSMPSVRAYGDDAFSRALADEGGTKAFQCPRCGRTAMMLVLCL